MLHHLYIISPVCLSPLREQPKHFQLLVWSILFLRPHHTSSTPWLLRFMNSEFLSRIGKTLCRLTLVSAKYQFILWVFCIPGHKNAGTDSPPVSHCRNSENWPQFPSFKLKFNRSAWTVRHHFTHPTATSFPSPDVFKFSLWLVKNVAVGFILQ